MYTSTDFILAGQPKTVQDPASSLSAQGTIAIPENLGNVTGNADTGSHPSLLGGSSSFVDRVSSIVDQIALESAEEIRQSEALHVGTSPKTAPSGLNTHFFPPICLAARNGNLRRIQGILNEALDPVATVNEISSCSNGSHSLLFAMQADPVQSEVISTLIQAKAAVNVVDDFKQYPLFIATCHANLNTVSEATYDSLWLVKVLLQAGADVNLDITDTGIPSCLRTACSQGNVNLVKLLIHSGAIMDNQYSDGLSLLDVAILKGHAEIAMLLLSTKGYKEQKSNNTGNTNDANRSSTLIRAVTGGLVNVVDGLLKCQADVNKARKADGMTPLALAVCCVNRTSLSTPANRGVGRERDKSRDRGDGDSSAFAICELLLKHKADMSAIDSSGLTPLMHVCCRPRITAGYYPDSSGPNSNGGHSDGPGGGRLLPLMLLYTSRLPQHSRNNVLNQLSRTDVRMSALMLACAHSNPTAVKQLLETSGSHLHLNAVSEDLTAAAGDIRAVTGQNITALGIACCLDDRKTAVEIAQMLLAYRADANQCGDMSLPPLFASVKANDVPLATLLIDHGAKVIYKRSLHKPGQGIGGAGAAGFGTSSIASSTVVDKNVKGTTMTTTPTNRMRFAAIDHAKSLDMKDLLSSNRRCIECTMHKMARDRGIRRYLKFAFGRPWALRNFTLDLDRWELRYLGEKIDLFETSARQIDPAGQIVGSWWGAPYRHLFGVYTDEGEEVLILCAESEELALEWVDLLNGITCNPKGKSKSKPS